MPREPQPDPSDRTLIGLLHETAAREPMPERDLAPGALRRLQRRQTAIANVNEFFGAIYTFVRGLGLLLGADETERRNAPQRNRTEDRHG